MQVWNHRARRCIVALLAVVLNLSSLAVASTLRIGGTGGALGAMQRLSAAFAESNPGVNIEVPPSLGSAGGIKALLAGAIDIALTSRPLKSNESETGGKALAYAKTPVVLATPKANPESGVTTAQLIEMYAGDRTTWVDGTRVRIVLRHKGSADRKQLIARIPGLSAAIDKAKARRGVPVTYTTQEAADKIQALRWGLGVVSLPVIEAESRPLKALSLDGIAPTLENVGNGAYPMAKTFHLVTLPDTSDLARNFIEFVRSAEGAAILRRTGHWVLDDNTVK